MALLGEDGYGYELARKLETNGIWRTWLGDTLHSALQPHLASPASWVAFMKCEKSPSKLHLGLQLKARALLFDKAAACLEASAPLSPSSLDASYLQLHADNVYFSLEQDTVDWSRLQAEGSPIVSSLLMKYGSDLLVGCSSAEDAEENRFGTVDGRQRKQIKATGPSFSLPVKAKQVQNLKRSISSSHTDQPEPATSSASSRFTGVGGGSGEGGSEKSQDIELWYQLWSDKNLLDRMHRLAWRASQRKLPFKDREACQRTPQGMAAYLACLEKVRRNRFIIKSDGKYSMPQVSLLKENGTREPSGSDMSSNYTREGSSNLTEEDTALLPEVIYPWNCVPDNPVPSRKRLHDDRHVVESMGPLDRLHLVSSQSHPGAKESLGIRSELRSPGSRQFESVSWKSEKTKSLTRRTGISEEEAHSVLQKAVVRIAADVGVQGLKQGAMECLSQLMSCHIRKLGSILRLLVDSYRNQCSQKELLKIFLGNCGCGDFGRLMEYTKAGIRSSGNQQSQPRNNPTQPLPVQPQVHQVQPESKLMTQQLSQQMPLLQQQSLTLQSQQLPDKGRRRQVSTPRGTIGGISSSTGRKSDKERGADIKSEMGTEAFNATDPKQSVQNVPLVSQQHQSSWQQQQQQPQQQQQLMQLTQSHHPHVMQQQVKQLSSSQLPSSIQQQSLLLRDTIPTKPPHVKVEGLHELMGSDVSIKQETEDDREGIIGSPSKRKR